MPGKFCQTRWVDSCSAANRALDIFHHIKKYKDPTVKLPQTTSVKNVLYGVKDSLMPAKIAFFAMVASVLEPFLRKFQADLPLAPYLYTEQLLLVNNLLKKFVNENDIPENPKRIEKINFKNASILKPLHKIDVGFAAKKYVSQSAAKEKDKSIFLKDCQKFLIATVSKILEKSGLKLNILRGISSLDPQVIAINQTVAENRMSLVLEELYNKNIISVQCAENAKNQFNKFIQEQDFQNLNNIIG